MARDRDEWERLLENTKTEECVVEPVMMIYQLGVYACYCHYLMFCVINSFALLEVSAFYRHYLYGGIYQLFIFNL